MKKKFITTLSLLMGLFLTTGLTSCGDTTTSQTTTDTTTSTTSVHTHTYDQEVAQSQYLKQAATCTAKAVYYASCVCGEKSTDLEFEYGELAPHTEVTDERVEPTCTTTGLTQGKHCEVCSQVLTPQEVIPVLGHEWGEIHYEWYTKDDGNYYCLAYRSCSRTNDTQTQEREEALATYAVTVEATCEEIGTGTYTATFSNTVFETQTKDIELNALGHTGGTATCTNKAICTRCNNEYGDVLAHSYIDKVLDNGTNKKSDATCTAKAVYYKVCEACNFISSDDTFEHGDLANHNIDASTKQCSTCSLYIDETQGLTYKLNDDNSTLTVNSCYIQNESVTIPDLFQEKKITQLANDLFKDNTTVKTVTMTDNITSGLYRTFMNATSLTSVTLSKNLNDNLNRTFWGCTSLKEITIPKNVKIGFAAFIDATSLETVTIENENTTDSIGQYAFYKTKLKGIDFSKFSNLTKIEQRAFMGCDYLFSVNIPDSVTSLGEYAFKQCHNLSQVKIGNGVTTIDKEAFYGCPSLLSLTLGSNVNTINENAFAYDYKLFEIYNLSSLSLTIGSEENGQVAKYAKDIYTNATDTTKFKNENSFIFYEDDNSKVLYGYANSSDNITLPEKDSSLNKEYYVGEYAFAYRTDIKTVNTGNSFTKIDKNAFRESSLENIAFGSAITSIEQEAFTKTQLTSLVIPSNVKETKINAFAQCTKLKTVDIKEGMETLGQGTFYRDSALEWVVIPKSITNVNQGAFQYCTALKAVYYGGNAEEFEQITFVRYNDIVKNESIRYYYSETKPTAYNEDNTDFDKKYWHYENDAPTAWIYSA